MSKKFVRFLIAEFLVIAWVVAVFRIVESKPIAGTFAGSGFVFVGALIFFEGLRSSELRKTPTFIMGCVHLFASALPLMLTRLANWTLAFDDVQVMGLPGPLFHKVSTTVYLLLIGATLFDWWRARRAAR